MPPREISLEQSAPFTGMMGASPSSPPKETVSPTLPPTTGMTLTAVVFWFTIPIAASSAIIPLMVEAGVSPGMAIKTYRANAGHCLQLFDGKCA